MQRTRLLPGAVLALLVGLVATLPVHGVGVMLAAPVPDRVALADVIVGGEVTAIEEKTVMAKRFPGDAEKVEYKIALVRIADAIKAPKGLTHIRLGFVPPAPVPAPPPPGVIRPPLRRFPQFNPTVGQEACFMLAKHSEADFHIVSMNFDVLDKKAGNFDKDVALIKRCTKLLDDANASLKSREAEERLVTASMLVTRYRTPRLGVQNPKSEPIAAEQSKLILQALAAADWSKREAITQLSPQVVLTRLNLTAKDGWTPPPFKDYQKEFPAYAQKWLKEHTDSYRIQRFVP
jgi:hypothetical protein